MPRPRNQDAPVPLSTQLPTSIYSRLVLHLHSPLQGRVPVGAFADFLTARAREYFEWRQLDLAPFGLPQGYFVRGPKEMVEKLEQRLKEAR